MTMVLFTYVSVSIIGSILLGTADFGSFNGLLCCCHMIPSVSALIASMSPGLGVKIKSYGLSDLHHLLCCSPTLKPELGSFLSCVFCTAALQSSRHCGSREPLPPPILPLLSAALTLVRAEHWVEEEVTSRWQSAPSPLFRPTALSYTHPPPQYQNLQH